MSPEIICEEEYDHRCDTWSIGILAYILLCGTPPFNSEDNDRDELDRQIVQDEMLLPQAMEGKLSGQVVDFLMKCLEKE
jgi:serine/threonine protein kinase